MPKLLITVSPLTFCQKKKTAAEFDREESRQMTTRRPSTLPDEVLWKICQYLTPLEGLVTREINSDWRGSWTRNLSARQNDTSPLRFRVLGPHSFDHSVPKELRRAAVRLWRVQDFVTQEEYVWAKVPKGKLVNIDFLQSWDYEKFFLVAWNDEFCGFCHRTVSEWPWPAELGSLPDEFWEHDTINELVTTLGIPYFDLELRHRSCELADIPFPAHGSRKAFASVCVFVALVLDGTHDPYAEMMLRRADMDEHDVRLDPDDIIGVFQTYMTQKLSLEDYYAKHPNHEAELVALMQDLMG